MNRIFLVLLLIFSGFLNAQETKIPSKIRKSIPLLAAYVTQGKISQLDKATAIYAWITHNIAYDYDELSSTSYLVGVDPSTILKSKKAISDGYVELMTAMLKAVNIESETIEGYVHDVAWEPGDLTLEPGHTWIAMKISGEWKLADPTWDAGYIGRLPIDKKPYSPKKYLISLEKIKNEKKRETTAEKRNEAEIKRKEAYDDKPDYKDEIGFVPYPTTEFFMMHPDTFLLTHLPIIPLWQLRSDYISVEDFALSEDSLKLRLATDNGNKQDFEGGIDLFRSRDFLHQYILAGEQGFKYNAYNPGIKAVNYFNFMSLVHSRNLQRYARGSVYEITEDKYPALRATNDTIIKYVKLYSVFEKELYKNRKEFDKEKYTASKTRDTENAKLIRKIDSENEKLVKFIGTNTDRIKTDLERIEETKKSILEKFPSAANYREPRDGLKMEYLQVWKDSMKMQVDLLTGIRDSLQNKRMKTSYNSLLADIQYIEYWMDANANSIQFNSYSNNENIERADSAITARSSHALMLYSDSLRMELVQKDVMGAVKAASTYVRSARTVFKALNTELKIDDVSMYEAALQADYYKILSLAEEINLASKAFNAVLIPVFKGNSTIAGLPKLMEKQIDYKAEKNEFIEDMSEKGHLRNTSLIERMKDDSKEWKQAYKSK